MINLKYLALKLISQRIFLTKQQEFWSKQQTTTVLSLIEQAYGLFRLENQNQTCDVQNATGSYPASTQ